MFPRKLTRQVVCNPDYPVVETKAGKLRGVVVEDAFIFRGIRYAEAERFHMPEPVTPWDGIKDAIMFGPVSMEISTGIAHDAFNVPHFYFPQDEACQYLNVWTQSIDQNAKKPVMVWIHGGGFSSGSSVELYAYDGEELSAFGDVVVVSLNHRLNCIGFLDLSDYGEEYRYSGNVGMADVIAALRWIKENIAQFGGDPNNVMIMGQSGGGMKVASLLQMPSADGLFHKASIQSGISDAPAMTHKEAGAFADKVVAALGLTKETIKEIENIPYFHLARACLTAAGEGGRMPWAPVRDDDFFMGNGVADGFREETKNIPILIGSVLGEMTTNYNVELELTAKSTWSDEKVDGFMKEMYGDKADAVMAAYQKAYPKHPRANALFVDKGLRRPTLVYAKARAAAGCAPVYTWLFNLECPAFGGTLPWHNAEEAYMFHNACYLEASYIPGVSEWLQDQMTGSWVRFAYTSCPDHPGIPYWTPTSPDSVPTMIFDREIELAVDHDKELMETLPDQNITKYIANSKRRQSKPLGGGPRQST